MTDYTLKIAEVNGEIIGAQRATLDRVASYVQGAKSAGVPFKYAIDRIEEMVTEGAKITDELFAKRDKLTKEMLSPGFGESISTQRGTLFNA